MYLEIKRTERVLVLRNGQPYKWLGPGHHTLWSIFADYETISFDVSCASTKLTPELEEMLPASEGVLLEVPEGRVACVRVDGVAHEVLGVGRWVLWQVRKRVTAELFDLNEDVLSLPKPFWRMLDRKYGYSHLIGPHLRGLLWVNGELVRELQPGRYMVSEYERSVRVDVVDMRERELQVVGQEVMTSDKVSVRVNVLVRYRVTNPETAVSTVDSYENGLYSEVQLAVRRWVAGETVESLLERRNQGSNTTTEEVRKVVGEWGLSVRTVDLKDVVLPGDMKALMNRVIEAQKEAEANVITRREETASTRSMANTAKMLESNPTLMRLKELETLKELASSVGEVKVVATEGALRLLRDT